MEFRDVLAARRMTRNFDSRPLRRQLLRELLELARNAPSAGFAQGTEFLLLDTPAAVSEFWEITLPTKRRSDFPWPGLLRAPALVLAGADTRRYLERYSQPDKASSAHLGGDLEAWPVPFWLTDAAFAVQNLLLAATERGLGSLFFGIFRKGETLRERLGIPAEVELLGAVALGHRAAGSSDLPSASTARGWRPLEEVLHWGSWGAHAC